MRGVFFFAVSFTLLAGGMVPSALAGPVEDVIQQVQDLEGMVPPFPCRADQGINGPIPGNLPWLPVEHEEIDGTDYVHVYIYNALDLTTYYDVWGTFCALLGEVTSLIMEFIEKVFNCQAEHGADPAAFALCLVQ